MPSTGPNYSHGFEERFFGAVETTFDTDTKPAQAEGISILESTFDPDNDIIMSDEKMGNRIAPDIYKGLRSAKGTVAFLVKPAAVGVAGNGAAILEAAFGTKTIVGGTSVTFSHTDTAVVKTLRLHRGAGNSLMESLYGAVVTQLGFEIKAGDVPKIVAQLAAARLARAKSAVLTAAATLGAGTCGVAAGQGMRFDKGSTVRFLKVGGSVEDNGGLGYLVTSDDADTVLFAPVAVSTAAIGDEIMAFTPTPTYVGTAVAAVSHDVSFGGTSLNFTEAKFTYNTGLNVKPEANADRPTRAFSGATSVDGEVTVYYNEQSTLGENVMTHWQKNFGAMVLRAGVNTAAQRMKISVPNAMIECVPVKLPSGRGTVGTSVLKFRGKTACSVIFD